MARNSLKMKCLVRTLLLVTLRRQMSQLWVRDETYCKAKAATVYHCCSDKWNFNVLPANRDAASLRTGGCQATTPPHC